MENQELNELKEKRCNLLIELGEETHKMIRLEKSEINDKMKELSQQIKSVDIAISHLSHPIDESCCPKCHRKLSPEEAFCRECGFAVKQFFDAYVLKCEVCGAPMKAEQNFCSVCGTKQKNSIDHKQEA